MKVKYFQDTDTLYIEFRADQIVATRDLDENTLPELDDHGRLCAMTVDTPASAPTFRGSLTSRLRLEACRGEQGMIKLRNLS